MWLQGQTPGAHHEWLGRPLPSAPGPVLRVGAAHHWAQRGEDSGKRGFPGGPSTLTVSLLGGTLATGGLPCQPKPGELGAETASPGALPRPKQRSWDCLGGGAGKYTVRRGGIHTVLLHPFLPSTALTPGQHTQHLAEALGLLCPEPLPRGLPKIKWRPPHGVPTAQVWAPCPPLAWAPPIIFPLWPAWDGCEDHKRTKKKEGLVWDSESTHPASFPPDPTDESNFMKNQEGNDTLG